MQQQGDNRPAVYVRNDGVVVYRASALGKCIKALVAARLGYPPMSPPENFANRFRDGHLHEPQILERLTEEHDIEVTGFQEVVELVVREGVIIRGSIDGKGVHPAHDLSVIDAKALSQASFESWCRDQWGSWESYAWQQSAYAYAMRDQSPIKGRPLPIIMAVKNKNTGALQVDVFPEPPVPLSKIKAKVLMVERIAASGELPDCDKNDYPCPYWFLHDEKEVDLATFDDVVEDPMVDMLATEYAAAQAEEREANKAVKAAKERKDKARQLIVEVLGERKDIKTSRFKVAMVTKTRKGYAVEGKEYEELQVKAA